MKRLIVIAAVLAVCASVSMAAVPVGPGRTEVRLISEEADHSVDIGYIELWNSGKWLDGNGVDVGSKLIFQFHFDTTQPWQIHEAKIYAGTDPVPLDKKGKPYYKQFTRIDAYEYPISDHTILLDLEDDIEWTWGTTPRILNVAFKLELVQYDEFGEIIATEEAWAKAGEDALPYGDAPWGWWFNYEMVHPRRGHFIDSPVGGATAVTPTFNGRTDASGAFNYFPGEHVQLSVGSLSLGNTVAEHKISPLDLFPLSDLEDPRVAGMARLLQSLDADADPKPGITITPEAEACLDQALFDHGLMTLDFGDAALVESVLLATQANCAGTLDLQLVSTEDALANLARSLDSTMFRKNISRTPELGSSKAKLNVMGVWFPARRANDELTTVEYYDENGALLRTEDQAKPIVITYTDEDPETGAHDVWGAISRDDGNTFKRKNLSRGAYRTSFTLANGEPFYGATKKPVFQVKGNNILVAWSSKFCKGGKPAYSIDLEDDYPYDDPYWTDDIFGVAGPQRSIDYTELGFPEVGEVPYSCVWVARGTVVTQGMINGGGFWADKVAGEIVWFKPERLTSARRDALQIFLGGGDGAGFAVAWQEDPAGLRPGKFLGPGHGWSGATTNHKTDIWYSYITMADFRKIDMNFVPGGDPEHDDPDFVGRPKALVPMSLPVRLSDNDVVNTDNLLVEIDPATNRPAVDAEGNWIAIPNYDADGDGDGTHRYGYELPGLCEGFYDFINYAGDPKSVCITEDGRLLDGDTGASRVNLFLQPYTKSDGTKSAWAILNYEETKGAGSGAPEHDGEGPYGDDYLAEQGKNVIYHSFDFQNPDLVSAGNILNLPEMADTDSDGTGDEVLYLQEDTNGDGVGDTLILDYLGQPQLAYENARRARFILQGKSALATTVHRTIMNIVYKEGAEGSGRPSDIFLRRVVVPEGQTGNPYRFSNIICDEWFEADNGQTVCIKGAQNVSTVTPTVTTPSMGDPEVEDPYGAVKVVEFEQTLENLDDASYTNPYEDARAHRGQIRGDLVYMGYSYTPNWAASRNGNAKYDFYIRRSFDGGQTWTTDPNPMTSDPYTTCNTFTDPLTKEKTEVCNTYGPGEFEPARNLSQLPNNKSSVIEPRIVCPPGTIKVDGVWTGIAEDKQNKNVCYVSYGLATNPKKDPETGEQEDAVPTDMNYSFTQDRGQSYAEVAWDVNPDSDGNYAGETVYRWDFLAKGDPEQGEAQLRSTPDGSRFYSCWLDEGEEGSDIVFRRIMSPEFPANVLP